MLRDREWTVAFFLGRSTVDFDRGRPTFGISPLSPAISGSFASRGLSDSPQGSKETGEGDGLANRPPPPTPPLEEYLPFKNDLKKVLELLRFEFQLESSPAAVGWGVRTMEL